MTNINFDNSIYYYISNAKYLLIINTALSSAFGSVEADKLLIKITVGLAVLYMTLAIVMSYVFSG